jgi:hypothetical protein
MTLEQLVDRYRLELQDETVGVRKSWEEMFRYTFTHVSKETDLKAFEVDVLSDVLVSSGMAPQIVEGYVKRWTLLALWGRNI